MLKFMCFFKFMCVFEMIKNNKGFYINYVIIEVIWVSDYDIVYLYDLNGCVFKYLFDLFEGDILIGSGLYMVNDNVELIYIDIKYNIKILFIILEIVVIFIEIKDCI